MTWMIVAATVVIVVAVVFNKAIKLALKLAAIGVVVLFAAYFLIQDGIIQ